MGIGGEKQRVFSDKLTNTELSGAGRLHTKWRTLSQTCRLPYPSQGQGNKIHLRVSKANITSPGVRYVDNLLAVDLAYMHSTGVHKLAFG
jgi:hypothetical protein